MKMQKSARITLLSYSKGESIDLKEQVFAH